MRVSTCHSLDPAAGWGPKRLPPFLRTLAATFALAGCSVEFETPDSWEEQAREFAFEHGLPSTIPEPGPRPPHFRCDAETPVGTLTITGDSPGMTTFELEGTEPESVPTPSSGVITITLVDGTKVWLYGDVLYFDGAASRIGLCAV